MPKLGIILLAVDIVTGHVVVVFNVNETNEVVGFEVADDVVSALVGGPPHTKHIVRIGRNDIPVIRTSP